MNILPHGYCDQNDPSVIVVLLKVSSLCSESTDRPTQTEIVLKSKCLYVFIYYIIESATVN